MQNKCYTDLIRFQYTYPLGSHFPPHPPITGQWEYIWTNRFQMFDRGYMAPTPTKFHGILSTFAFKSYCVLAHYCTLYSLFGQKHGLEAKALRIPWEWAGVGAIQPLSNVWNSFVHNCPVMGGWGGKRLPRRRCTLKPYLICIKSILYYKICIRRTLLHILISNKHCALCLNGKFRFKPLFTKK